MIYIKKGVPPRNVASKIAEIKSKPEWKKIPAIRPTNPDQQKGYGEQLRMYFDQLPKDEIRESVLKEQHYLCAYCMRPLPDAKSVVVEHWYPLSQARDTAIDYRNFLGSCNGIYSEGQHTHSCCDHQKSGQTLTIDPRSELMMDCIKYESDGTIYLDAPAGWDEKQKREIKKDINQTLCLNGPESELTLHRKRVLLSCREKLRRLHIQNKCTVANVKKLLQEIEKQEAYPAYAGVMLFYYKRWLQNHT